MSGGEQHLILSGPLLFAVPVAAAAGAVTFLSPCVLPLVPGYLSYVTGMSGVGVQQATGADAAAGTAAAGGAAAGGAVAGGSRGEPAAPDAEASEGQAATAVTTMAPSEPARPKPVRRARRRAVLGTTLFVLGFSAVFASEGVAFGGLGALLQRHSVGLTQVFGVLTILLGLLFCGLFDRIPVTGRILRPSLRPRAGLAGPPVPRLLMRLRLP